MEPLILLSARGSDRATAYLSSNKIIRKERRLFVGWLDGPEVAGGPERIQLGVCDAGSGALVSAYCLGEGIDNHCGPAITMDREGRLHAILGAHSGVFAYRWSDEPESLASWSPPELLGPYDTYPSLVVDGAGTLHLLSRESGAHPRKLIYRRRFQGRGWEEPIPIALSPRPGYTNFMHSLSVGPEGRLHLTFQYHYLTHGVSPADAVARLAAWITSDDGGDTWHQEGEKISLPLCLETTRGFLAAPDGGIRLSNHVVDSKGRLWIFSSSPEKGGGILFRRDEEGWTEIDTEQSLGTLDNRDGREISLSRDASGLIHLVIGTVPGGLAGTWKDPRHELFHLVLEESGKQHDFHQLTNFGQASWLPSLENWNWFQPACTDTPWMLFTREKNGNSPTDVFLTKLQREPSHGRVPDTHQNSTSQKPL